MYGRFGHVFKGNELYDDITPENELQYGPKLRASPLTSIRCNAEVEMQNEKKALTSFS